MSKCRYRRGPELEAVTDELTAAGIDYDITNGKRHIQVRFTANGRANLVICGGNAGDPRAVPNARSRVRRMIRAALTPPA